MELERVGLRNGSYPLDWIISGSFKSVITMIENHFEGFIDKNNLFQEFDINPSYYYNKACNVHFYHDFSPYKSLDCQYDYFAKKYSRRIDRFYETVKHPTIFIRYCMNLEDLEYIKINQQQILTLLKTFNSQNEIIYIAHTGKHFDIENIYYVEKDVGDGVARTFLKKLPELREHLTACSILTYNIGCNLKRYRKKKIKKVFRKLLTKFTAFLHLKPYYHYQQYEELKNYE